MFDVQIHSRCPTDYLRIDRFLARLLPARALMSAMRCGLIDQLVAQDSVAASSLVGNIEIDSSAMEIMIRLLVDGDVVCRSETAADAWQLTSEFRAALPYRDLLEAKLDLALLLTNDYVARFDQLLFAPREFHSESTLMDLFGYDRCIESTEDNVRRTREWMRYTTILTQYEADVLLDQCDFSRCQHLLDIGGNSGELVRKACQQHSALRATVMDLPVVCQVGEDYLATTDEIDRITFRPGNALTDTLPDDIDWVVFKSMLHDWPDEAVETMLERAVGALPSGGGLVIFERLPVTQAASLTDFHLLPLLLFFRSFRRPDLYVRTLDRLGLHVRWHSVSLDVPFMFLKATKE